MEVRGRIVAVTGAGSGIGRVLCLAPALSFDEDVLMRFADLMRNNISEGKLSLRKRYLKTLIARVVVGQKTIRI